jgi:hypothetical protein
MDAVKPAEAPAKRAKAGALAAVCQDIPVACSVSGTIVRLQAGARWRSTWSLAAALVAHPGWLRLHVVTGWLAEWLAGSMFSNQRGAAFSSRTSGSAGRYKPHVPTPIETAASSSRSKLGGRRPCLSVWLGLRLGVLRRPLQLPLVVTYLLLTGPTANDPAIARTFTLEHQRLTIWR